MLKCYIGNTGQIGGDNMTAQDKKTANKDVDKLYHECLKNATPEQKKEMQLIAIGYFTAVKEKAS